MPTPSSDTHSAATAATSDSGDTLQFRAATLEEAIAMAESSLGTRVRVVAANRIRRGGIGGFFAADLGVEVTVALDDETVEQALERLVADSSVEDRLRFEERLDAQDPAFGRRSTPEAVVATTRPTTPTALTAPMAPTGPTATTPDPFALLGGRFDRRDDEPPRAVNPVLAEVVAAIVAEAADRQALAAAGASDEDHPVTSASSTPAVQRRATSPDSAAPLSRSEQRTAHRPQTLGQAAASPEMEPHDPPVLLVASDLGDEPGTRPLYTAPPTMLKVEQIMAELSAITAEPVFGDRSRPRVARPTGRERVVDIEHQRENEQQERHQQEKHQQEDGWTSSRVAASARGASPKIMPTLPPRSSDVARRASQAAHAAQTRFLTNRPPDLLEQAIPMRPSMPMLPGATRTSSAATSVSVEPPASAVSASSPSSRVLEQTDRSIPFDVSSDLDGEPGAMRIEAIIDDSGSDDDGSAAAPSQRQVELAVAATDQLLESLKREDGVKRLSVRVVLRTGDHREVEAEAEWEAS